MKALVTGAAGFIGSNLCKQLLEDGWDVVGVDDCSTGDRRSVPDGVAYADVDVGHEGVFYPSQGCDVIFHLAARNIMSSVEAKRADLRTNALGTIEVLEAARIHKCKVIYTSTASVYGNPLHLPVREDAAIDCLSPYSVSKYAGEGYVKVYGAIHGVEAVTLRLSNVYGPQQRTDNPHCGVVAKFIDGALEIGDKAAVVYGDGQQTRDYTYVDDVVRAIIMAYKLAPAGGVYNISTGVETSVEDLMQLVCDATDKPMGAIEQPDRAIDNIRRRCLSINAARLRMKWAPIIRLPEGIRKTVKWVKDGKPW